MLNYICARSIIALSHHTENLNSENKLTHQSQYSKNTIALSLAENYDLIINFD